MVLHGGEAGNMGRVDRAQVVERPRPTMRELLAPREAGIAIDEACESDRVFFERHPELNRRVRAAVAGEFWPLAVGEILHVEVTRVAPGVRARVPVERRGK